MRYLPPLKGSKFVGFLMMLGLGLHSEAKAALVISDGDISSGHYIYDLTYVEMNTSTVFDNDVLSQVRMEVVQEGTDNPNYLSPIRSDNSGYTTAEFTYKFDFTTTSYRPTSVNVYDILTGVWPDGGPHETLTTAYSLDGINYTPIRTLTTVGATSFVFLNSNGTTNVDLSSMPSVFYYKTTFVANDLSFGFGWNGAQWNRTLSDFTPFSTDFTVVAVPEPGAVALLVMGGSLVLVGGLRRKTQASR